MIDCIRKLNGSERICAIREYIIGKESFSGEEVRQILALIYDVIVIGEADPKLIRLLQNERAVLNITIP